MVCTEEFTCLSKLGPTSTVPKLSTVLTIPILTTTESQSTKRIFRVIVVCGSLGIMKPCSASVITNGSHTTTTSSMVFRSGTLLSSQGPREPFRRTLTVCSFLGCSSRKLPLVSGRITAFQIGRVVRGCTPLSVAVTITSLMGTTITSYAIIVPTRRIQLAMATISTVSTTPAFLTTTRKIFSRTSPTKPGRTRIIETW